MAAVPAVPEDPMLAGRLRRARDRARTADRDDELADVAELMGDDATAAELRTRAHRGRMDALRLLDG